MSIRALKEETVSGEVTACRRDDGSIYGYKDAGGKFLHRLINGRYYRDLGETYKKEEVVVFSEKSPGSIDNCIREYGAEKLAEFKAKFPNRTFELYIRNIFKSDYHGSREVQFQSGCEIQIREIKEPSIEWLKKIFPEATKFVKEEE